MNSIMIIKAIKLGGWIKQRKFKEIEIEFKTLKKLLIKHSLCQRINGQKFKLSSGKHSSSNTF